MLAHRSAPHAVAMDGTSPLIDVMPIAVRRQL
jgi:hypothetical protein